MNIIDLIFPKKCLECQKPRKYICDSCLEKVSYASEVCPECRRSSNLGKVHTFCKKPDGLDGLVSIWSYDGVIHKAIIALKYKFASDVARELAEVIVTKLQSDQVTKFSEDSILIPVPLHSARERWRGFNQSEEVGKLIAKKMRWKFRNDILVRTSSRKPQVGLRGTERRSNIKDVFSLRLNYFLVSGTQCLVLFDDVWTTGSTLKEAARVLKSNGAKEVWGLTIAR
ncbi:hypothetical protein A3D00_05415 [Candidatus Woesebacteria bacterium RIFCSPHIGHO2_02_FULL_38_9]|uniref:Phosphoribosyltransferase domain-containing protein n=1 Tax=Candidatus Woesebacteria bacterium RIFCSPHIGHO2_01_FULL_39_28 TaxID=1802496 RepID=A0A1F7YJ16_9BACT|nr:MAG: hypothetical protein A2627_05735 [Candidatus Woesebacteria bacterium RIFCSPHIGHO2_01_FULL_39_28]OGM33309.1 MAG: hypothetical protein A3D00_05415 [Candidatus Woesebacteria bacterium RIFCSPHIGHO2_02_FULL_38_9]OGM56672.1 MAG: hypothetical protein A3A50_04930 [Candidatus Woesebacteria bacterium RIFCSPLOWO2_01_FULL_38_20]